MTRTRWGRCLAAAMVTVGRIASAQQAPARPAGEGTIVRVDRVHRRGFGAGLVLSGAGGRVARAMAMAIDTDGRGERLADVRILSFSYRDLVSGWTLEKATFDGMNLLVGASGVGKTQVVESLRAVVTVALLDNATLPQAKWELRYEDGDRRWRWEGETGVEVEGPGFPGMATVPTIFLNERLEDEQRGTVVFRRQGPQVELDKPTPEVPAVRSLFGSFTTEAVKEARDVLRGTMFSAYSGRTAPSVEVPYSMPNGYLGALEDLISQSKNGAPMVEKFLSNALGSSLMSGLLLSGSTTGGYLLSWYVAQETNAPQFRALCSKFQEVFPSVEDVRVRRSDGGDRSVLHFEIRERDVSGWIAQASISSGMFRTMIHLHEFLFAPPGTVIVIDEFENSLGINCLPVLTELMLERTDCQFIVTSHHPYVIGNIPMNTWRVVKRHGLTVRLLPSQDVPRLRGHSRIDAFTRLINALQDDDAA